MERIFSMAFTVSWYGQPYSRLVKRLNDQDGIVYFGFEVSRLMPGRVEVFLGVKPYFLPVARRIIGNIPTARDLAVASPLPIEAEKPPGEVLMVVM